MRVDATQSDGWFYEGAGIYRHVWLVKTNAVHVKKWGTFARAEVKQDEAAIQIRTEVVNQGIGAQNTRVTSTVLAPDGKAVAKMVSAPTSIGEVGSLAREQRGDAAGSGVVVAP